MDETRRSGGVSEGVIAALADAGYRGAVARVTSADSYVPLGDAAAQCPGVGAGYRTGRPATAGVSRSAMG